MGGRSPSNALVLLALLVAGLASCGGRTSLGGPPEGGSRRDGRVDGPRPKPLDGGDRWGPWWDTTTWPDLPKPWWPDLKPKVDKQKLDKPKPYPDGGACVGLGGLDTATAACCPGLQPFLLGTGVNLCSTSCTPDDLQTPLVNEDSCPDLTSFVCAAANPSFPSQHLCLRRCKPAYGTSTCGAGLACHWTSTSYSQSIDEAVCVFPRCTSNKECPIYTATSCSSVGAPCSSAGVPTGSFCAADETSPTGGSCAMAGICDLGSGLCAPHVSTGGGAIGATCKDDRDCKSGMRCDRERTTSGLLHARGGYCTLEGCAFAASLPQRACPSGSVCNRLFPGGRCFKACKLETASDCRGNPNDKHGDYDCYAWNNLAAGTVMIADAPTCEPADTYPCDFFAQTKLDCSYLGNYPGNSTQMACRDRATGAVKPAPTSPDGFCLDTTSSGP
jgi:hypothetical protein